MNPVPQSDYDVAVIGCGLGIIHARLAKLRGAAPVILLGTNKKRLEMAKAMGAADFTVYVDQTVDPVAEVRRLTDGIGADFVIEAVGSSKTYEQAFQMARRGGKVEAFGICSDDDFASLAPVEFVIQEKKVSGSTAGIGYDWGDAITLLKYGMLDPAPMVSMIVPLEELVDALVELRENKELIKVLVAPGQAEHKILYK